MIMKRIALILPILLLISSCAAPPPIDERVVSDYQVMMQLRSKQFRSAAYMIDLRINDAGRKFSVTTSVYFSGDSVGFFGNAYLGKEAFKGNVINDQVTVYFKSENEYYNGLLADMGTAGECAGPGEVLLYVLSLLTGKSDAISGDHMYKSRREISFYDGRFERTVRLNKNGFPQIEKLIDPHCGDSIVIKYDAFSREFPFYKVQNILYYSEQYNFRARGFIREQKYGVNIKQKKFLLDIPSSATRLDGI
jgi:hypothetical protein